MWKNLPPVSKKELSDLRRSKKMRLYADEDIEEEVVELFRDNGVNITSARELGHRGKPDSFQAARAFKDKRFLLTKNAKHYLDDRKVPFTRLQGVVVIEGDMNDAKSYFQSILHVFDLIPYGQIYEVAKIRTSAEGMIFRFIKSDGTMATQRYKTKGENVYQWVDN
jgi:hypothetical protein